MKWNLILSLSGFGLAMALGTVFFIPPAVEPVLWLVIFLACAVLIARARVERPFLHGLAVSIANSVWMTSAHILFAETYLAGHPNEAQMSAGMASPRLMMLITGPIIGVVSGLVLGLFAFIAAKIVARKS